MRWAVRNADDDLAYALLAPVWRQPLWDLPAGRALFVFADDVLDLVRAAHSENVADAVGYAALLANEKGDQDRAAALATEALALADPDSLAVYLAWATRSLQWVMTGDFRSNVENVERIRAWVRRAGNPYDVAWMLVTSVMMQIGNRDFEGARGRDSRGTRTCPRYRRPDHPRLCAHDACTASSSTSSPRRHGT